ncbi:PREDICTED: UDP-glucuronosyltransferase 3A2-like [Dufourea novaeangliae]|uniref:UDP-glucuronosyltransferase 3A2-like n=1 Tax=Dufourea novaeangliae TaxID=178035 RepID=UPI000767798C|nr:PREDICTED: UDP-glucuronosyltransferase 3A2-like [Dufourea novaeangliae]
MSRLYISVIIIAFSSIAAGSRILGIFPYPAYSHQVVFRAYTLELLKRGHELVVFTTYPMKDSKLANYTEVDLSAIKNEWKNRIDFFQLGKQENAWSFVRLVMHFGEVISESVLSHPAMQEIIATNSTQKFDVILMQHLFYDALYALSIHLNIPMVGISSLELLTLHRLHFGNEIIMSYGRSALTGNLIDNLWDRMYEAYCSLRIMYMYKYLNLPIQEKVLRKHFGDSMPPIEKLSNQMEILLVSSHPYFSEPHSHVPAIIYIGRCRFVELSGNTTMSEDLKEILDKATSGFIYFSMGSNVKISQLPMKVRNAILASFAELPYTVIWKSEIAVDNKPNNVIIRNWLPQQEILG